MWRVLTVMAFIFGSSVAAIEPVNDPLRIPLTFKDGLPFITATIGGKSLGLYVDLGGHAALALSPQALAKISVQPPSANPRPLGRYADAFGGIHDIHRFVVPMLEINGLHLGATEGIELVSGPPSAAGYIGLGLLVRYLAVFDYQHAELRLYASGSTGALQRECPTAQFAFSLEDNGVRSTLNTGQGPLVMVWDTGATANVIRPSVLGAAGHRSLRAWLNGQVRVIDGVLDGHPLGPIDFHRVEFKQPDAAGVLGYDFFESRVLCFDFEHLQGGMGQPAE